MKKSNVKRKTEDKWRRKELFVHTKNSVSVCVLLAVLMLSMLIMPEKAAAAPKLNHKSLTMAVGMKQKLTVKYTTKKVTWKSSKKSIAVVSKKGIVTAKKRGKAVMTATVGKKKLDCKIKVVAAVTKINTNLTINNTGMVGVTYLSDEIYVKSSNPEIATAYVVSENAKSELGYGMEADIMVYGHKSGTAKITITNDCNREKMSFKVIVKKTKNPETKQQLADLLLKSGKTDAQLGDKYFVFKNDAYKTCIVFEAMDNTISYQYVETTKGNNVEWNLFSTENGGDEYYITMHLPQEGKTESRFVTAKICAKTFELGETIFEEGWYREAVDASCNQTANEMTERAFSRIGALLEKKTDFTWKDLNFLLVED